MKPLILGVVVLFVGFWMVQAPDSLELPVRKDHEGNVIPPEPDTPIRPARRWVDRLAEGSPLPSPGPSRGFGVWYGDIEWRPGMKSRIVIGLVAMWLLNVLWVYPEQNTP